MTCLRVLPRTNPRGLGHLSCPQLMIIPGGPGSDPGVFQEYQQALPPPRLQLPPAFHKLILHIIT